MDEGAFPDFFNAEAAKFFENRSTRNPRSA